MLDRGPVVLYPWVMAKPIKLVRVGAWWTGSFRPDLWTPGEWDVVSSRDRTALFVDAWSSRAQAQARLDKSQGWEDVAGVAEALIFAGQIVERPWT